MVHIIKIKGFVTKKEGKKLYFDPIDGKTKSILMTYKADIYPFLGSDIVINIPLNYMGCDFKGINEVEVKVMKKISKYNGQNVKVVSLSLL